MCDQEHEQDNISALQLEPGLSFPNWQLFKVWLDPFVLQEGFNYKIRNSNTNEGIVRRVNYVWYI